MSENTPSPDEEFEDEISALSSIFCEDWRKRDQRLYELEVPFDSAKDASNDALFSLLFFILFPVGYPLNAAAEILDIQGVCSSKKIKLPNVSHYIGRLNEASLKLMGEASVFSLHEDMKLIVSEVFQALPPIEEKIHSHETTEKLKDHYSEEEDSSHDISQAENNTETGNAIPESSIEITHAEPVTIKRSTFQAHLARISSKADVSVFLRELFQSRKIANATHNMYAYRLLSADKAENIIDSKDDLIIQDCDDDGETHAGSRLLHLLEIIDAKNVMVVVTRWYGGILLGPERFKIISNCARNILSAEGFISSAEDSRSNKTKHSKVKPRKR